MIGSKSFVFRIHSWAFVLFAALAIPQASFADRQEEIFQSHYKKGLRAYNHGDYGQAIREFQAAFAIRQLPRLLFNLGQAHRKLGHAKEALGYLQNYLRVQPNPTEEDRRELASYIAATKPLVEIAEEERKKLEENEKRELEERQKVAQPEPKNPEDAAAEKPESKPNLDPPKEVPKEEVKPISPVVSPGVEKMPIHKQWWFWTTLSGAVATVVVVGAVAGSAGADRCPKESCFTPYSF